jgi:hypothetical protein
MQIIEEHLDELMQRCAELLLEDMLNKSVKISSGHEAYQAIEPIKKLLEISGVSKNKEITFALGPQTHAECIEWINRRGSYILKYIRNFSSAIIEHVVKRCNEFSPGRGDFDFCSEELLVRFVEAGLSMRTMWRTHTEATLLTALRVDPSSISIQDVSNLCTPAIVAELFKPEHNHLLMSSSIAGRILPVVLEYLTSLTDAEKLTSPSAFVRSSVQKRNEYE